MAGRVALDEESKKLIAEINAAIKKYSDESTERFKAAEADRGDQKVRLEKLETAHEEDKKSLQTLLQSIPKAGGARDIMTQMVEGKQRDRELMNKQARLILTSPIPKAVEADAKALQMSIGASGGFAVGTQMSTEIIEKGQFFSVMLQNADVINVGDVAQGTLLLEDGDFTWSSVASLAQPTETAFTDFIKQQAWALSKQAAFATMDNDLLRYSELDIAARLTDKGGRSVGNKADDWFIDGSGSGEPSGLRNSQGLNTASQAGASLDWDDLTAIEHALLPHYRNEGVFLFNDSVHALLVAIEDGMGRPMFESAVELRKLGIDSDFANQTGRIRLPGRSYPYFIVNSTAMSNTLGAGSDESEILFGLPRFYQIRQSQSGLEVSMDSSGANWRVDQTQIKLTYRPHGILTQGETWVLFTGAK